MGFPARHALALAGACTIALWLPGCGDGHSQEDTAEAPPQVGVVVLASAPLDLTRELPGRTRAMQVAEIRPQVGGIVRRRLFVEGQTVRAGQPLYQLDDATYRARHDSAQAALRKAEATLNAARHTAQRMRELAGIRAVSTQDSENAALAEDQARADVGVARAALESARIDLAHTRIVSPIDGRIGKSSVTEGALVTADQDQPMALVQTLDPIYVDANLPSADWLALKQALDAGHLDAGPAGTPVTLQLENGTRYPHAGRLQFSDVTVDPDTGNLLLRAEVPNPESTLLPGMYVRAVVREGLRANALLVPQTAIALDADGKASALVVGRDDKVEQRSVRVSRTVGDRWLVEDGLRPGERVIVEGVQKVAPDDKVQPVPVKPASPPAPLPATGAAG